jgi:DNA-binding MarR family transcriptional regulator/GNAT superfamily N-acetyltransferase
MAAGAVQPLASQPERSIQTVRRFNRFYTRQIGLLQEGLLKSRFSLTEVRVLYELAHREQSTAAELCRELGLDRGYLSRILQDFEKQKLIEKTSSHRDARQSLLFLTGKGRKAFEPLNARSNKEVAGMLEQLPRNSQDRLLQAMQSIERVLSPSSRPVAAYVVRPHQPGDMGWVVHRHGVLYWQEYRYDERFEALVAEIVAEFIQHLDAQHFDAQRERCWIAESDGEILGSVFLVQASKTVAKLRLLLVEPSARGLGIGRRLVDECVVFAKRAGYKKIALWTQSELVAARHIYERAGFHLTGKKAHQSWGRDNLVSETWELKLHEREATRR